MPGDIGCDPLRVLVIEDEGLVALQLQQELRDLGYRVVGPASSVETALQLIDAESIEVALLDINLRGESALPVAAALHRRGIPFAVVTGYGTERMDGLLGQVPCLLKPFLASDLAELFRELLGRGRRSEREPRLGGAD
ncbi:MAG TPA: response regulator [Dongiaceae bacterium]|nr:response regulator [Dongiaceae bacterium]